MIEKGRRLATLLGLNNDQPWRMTRMAQMLAAVGARHSQDLRHCQVTEREITIIHSTKDPVDQIKEALLLQPQQAAPGLLPQPQQVAPVMHLKVDEFNYSNQFTGNINLPEAMQIHAVRLCGRVEESFGDHYLPIERHPPTLFHPKGKLNRFAFQVQRDPNSAD